MIAGELVTRARGLATRLASEDALAGLDRAPDAGALAGALAALGIAPALPGPEEVEAAVRERVAADLAILARWAGDHAPALAALTLDEDRRSLRAQLRGIAGGTGARRRVAACTPTPTLPAGRLAELARTTSVPELAAAVARLDHPLAHPLAPGLAAAPAAAGAHPDLLALEAALARAWAAAARAAIPAGGAALAAYLAQAIDAENAVTALLLAQRGRGLDPAPLFLDGGARLPRAAFLAAAASLDEARERLGRAFEDTPLAAALFAPAPDALEDAILAWQLAAQARRRRAEPDGLAAVLHLLLRRRREARRVRRAAWRVALGGAGSAS